LAVTDAASSKRTHGREPTESAPHGRIRSPAVQRKKNLSGFESLLIEGWGGRAEKVRCWRGGSTKPRGRGPFQHNATSDSLAGGPARLISGSLAGREQFAPLSVVDAGRCFNGQAPASYWPTRHWRKTQWRRGQGSRSQGAGNARAQADDWATVFVERGQFPD